MTYGTLIGPLGVRTHDCIALGQSGHLGRPAGRRTLSDERGIFRPLPAKALSSTACVVADHRGVGSSVHPHRTMPDRREDTAMWHGSRRDFLRTVGAIGGLALTAAHCTGRTLRRRPTSRPTVEVLNPRMRVPLSFIIDDSTCLVNMGRFCMPQFATAWPDRDEYKKPWKTWPVEIPDAFVREFGQWCAEHGVKGKYSIVPYPACVGWLDRELPGWSREELVGQPAARPRTDGAQLGHPSGDDHAHAGPRSADRPAVVRDQRRDDGELVSADAQERGRAGGVSRLCPADPEELRSAVRRDHDARRLRGHGPGRTLAGRAGGGPGRVRQPRFRTTSSTSRMETKVPSRASNTCAMRPAPIRV